MGIKKLFGSKGALSLKATLESNNYNYVHMRTVGMGLGQG
jgi:hypothetical protein